MNKYSYRKTIWIEAISRARRKLNIRVEISRIIIAILFTLLIIIVLFSFGMWNESESIPGFMWGLFGTDIVLIISTVFAVPITAYFYRWNIAAEMDAKKDQKIDQFERLLDISDIDISLEPSPSPNGEYVSLKVTNNNKNEFVLCKAIVKRMELLKPDPKLKNGGEWKSINLDRSGPLSWHHGGTDNDGYKKVHLNSEFINVAKVPKDTNHLLRGNMLFTFIVEKPYKFGRYKILIEVYCKCNTKSKVEIWMGCIDMVDSDGRNIELTILECDDTKEWE